MSQLSGNACAVLIAVAVLMSNGCAVTAGIFGIGKAPADSQTRAECLAAEEAGADLFVRSATIGGNLLRAQSPDQTPGVPGGWIRLTAPVAVAAQGNDVFIADLALRQVLKFDRGTQRAGVFVTVPRMTIDTRLFLDRALSLYVTVPLSGEVTQFNLDGRPVRRFASGEVVSNPVATVVDDLRGEILIADQLSARIGVFNRNGGLVRTIGADTTSGAVRFASISAMAIAGDQLYVVDRLEGQVSALGLNGSFRYAFGDDELTAPSAIAADRDNRVFVADRDDASIKVYRGGQMQNLIGGGGSSGIAYRGISSLWASDDSLYVADAERGTVDILDVQQRCP